MLNEMQKTVIGELIFLAQDHSDLNAASFVETVAESAGVARAEARRAFLFVELAIGNAWLHEIGAKSAKRYFGFDEAGRIIESGKLADEPYYKAARRLYAHPPAQAIVHKVLVNSAAYAGMMDAIAQGHTPSSLACGDAMLLLGEPRDGTFELVCNTVKAMTAHGASSIPGTERAGKTVEADTGLDELLRAVS